MVKRFVTGVLLALVLATPALALDRGDWVLGRWQGGKFWFPGIVQQAGGGQVTIKYDDGTKETLPRKLVKRYDWTIGTRVECDWKGGGTWYRGNIAKLNGGELVVAYDDGSRERTVTGRCRSR
jgi:hypothetical protein